jgi:hypothetical protein
MTQANVEAGYGSLLTAGPADGGRVTELWSLFPRELASLFRPVVPAVAAEAVAEIRVAVPEFASAMAESGDLIVANVRHAMLQFLDRLGNPAAAPEDSSRTFRRLGEHEMHQGRSLNMLQTAYRVGARVSWRRMSEIGARAGIPATTLCTLAEAIFAYIDELSALSIEGHAEARAKAAGALELRRRRLLELVLAEPPASGQAIAQLAGTANWTVPARVVPVALAPRPDQHEVREPSFGEEVLTDLDGGAPCLLLPAPDADLRDRLPRELAGWQAAAGFEVELTGAGRSLHWARRALEMVRGGTVPGAPVVWCEDHLADLWLRTEPFLAGELADQELAPLAGVTGKRAGRLAETLLAWLETRGNVRAVAQRLAVHPQTVRARLQELETLFGEHLADPDRRFAMVLALRAAQARYPARATTALSPLNAVPGVCKDRT